jgi:2-oxoglutarate dehydrogenase E1 component
MFHLLRRQVLRPLRRPLIVMTPKSLLRHKDAISTLEDLSQGAFFNVIDDNTVTKVTDITRVVFCSGKVYYDLDAKRQEDNLTHVAIVRIEQLYPFPDEELKAILKRYKNIAVAAWCQEEPMNQGAWYSSQHHIRRAMNACFPGLYLHYAGRDASAAAAAGYMSLHVRQQEKLVQEALYNTSVE